MNWLDIVLLLAIAGAVFNGFTSGLVRTALGLVGLVAGVLLGGRYYLSVADLLGFIPNDAVTKIVAFLLIFCISIGAANLLGAFLAKGLRFLPFVGCLDRLAGAVLGLLMGSATAAVVVALLVRFPLPGLEAAAKQSALAPYLLDYLPFMLALLPPEFEGIRSFLR